MSKNCINSLSAALELDTRALCRPEGRMVGTEGHRHAESFLTQRLSDIGLIPYRGKRFDLQYEQGTQSFTNLVGVAPGRDRSLAPLLVGAHYDSAIKAPSADDNGAAVAISLALGELAEAHGGLERDLVLAFFDAEEPPYFRTPLMGSTRFYEDQLDPRGVHFALIYDLVGHDVSLPLPLPRSADAFGLAGLVFAMGAESHPALPELIAGINLPERLKMIATLNEYVGDMSDHGVFRRNGVPYLFLSCGHWRHYHAPTDTPDRLNYRKMARLVQFSWDLLSDVAFANLPQGMEERDTVAFEAETFRRSAGTLFPLLCRWAGTCDLSDRWAIDRVVAKLLRLGL